MKRKKNKKVIVILDDNKRDPVVGELENLCTNGEYDIFSFYDAREFVETITEMHLAGNPLRYHVAIIDLNCAEKEYGSRFSMGGKEIIDKLKKMYPNRKVICRSNYGHENYVPHTKADRVIIKNGYSAEKILQLVEELTV